MKKIDTPVTINFTVSNCSIYIKGNAFEYSQPLAMVPKASGSDKSSLALSIAKTLELMGPGLPAIFDFLEKAA